MIGTNSLRQVVRHPATIGTTVFAVLGGLANLPFVFEIFGWAATHSGTLFTVSSVLGFTVAPNLGLPAWPFIGAAVGSGLLFAGWRLYGALDDLRGRLRS